MTGGSSHIWMNGELVAFEDAKVHVLTHALHYGTGGGFRVRIPRRARTDVYVVRIQAGGRTAL